VAASGDRTRFRNRRYRCKQTASSETEIVLSRSAILVIGLALLAMLVGVGAISAESFDKAVTLLLAR
jgi:hypothetical protein